MARFNRLLGKRQDQRPASVGPDLRDGQPSSAGSEIPRRRIVRIAASEMRAQALPPTLALALPPPGD
jgi:hypothetical protein